MRNGYKMQLMIYMISASGGGPEPAGIFYFNIKDPIESADRMSDKKFAEVRKADLSESFKLKGSYIDEPGVLNAMPAEVLAGSRAANSKMTREEYESLRNDVLESIKNTASGIMSGNIKIRPFKDGRKLVCNNCSYKSICMRDREYVRNKGRELPPEPKPERDPEA
jgi:ATP-dependent helicase/nuclease subunit B